MDKGLTEGLQRKQRKITKAEREVIVSQCNPLNAQGLRFEVLEPNTGGMLACTDSILEALAFSYLTVASLKPSHASGVVIRDYLAKQDIWVSNETL